MIRCFSACKWLLYSPLVGVRMTWTWNIRKCTQILSVCVPTEKVLSICLCYTILMFLWRKMGSLLTFGTSNSIFVSCLCLAVTMMVTWVVSKRSLWPCWSSGPKLVVIATLTFLMMIPCMIPVLIDIHRWDYVQDLGVISCPDSHIETVETPITSHNLGANIKPPFYKVLRSPIVTRPGITNCTLTL